jgi:HSP20 family protein
MMHNYFHQYKGFMPYDLEEDDDSYWITMPLPGFESKEIEVSVRGSDILIEAHHENEPDSPEEKPTRKAVSMGRYIWNRPIKVRIPVTEEIDPEKVKARLKRGLLNVEFPKLPKKSVPVEEDKE